MAVIHEIGDVIGGVFPEKSIGIVGEGIGIAGVIRVAARWGRCSFAVRWRITYPVTIFGTIVVVAAVFEGMVETQVMSHLVR
jgi:hypothetical protein